MMWPFGKKKVPESPAQSAPGDIHPKHKVSPVLPPIQNPTSAPAKPMPPPITPTLSASEIAEMRQKAFEKIKVDYQTVQKIEEESSKIGQPLRIDPDKLEATRLEINGRLKQYFIELQVSPQEALLCLYEQSKYEAQCRRLRASGVKDIKQIGILDIVIWREAEQRQKRLMDLPESEFSKHSVKQELEAGTKEIFNTIIENTHIQQEREQAIKRIRFERNLKPTDPIKKEDIDAMVQKIKDRRTPPPRKAGMPADEKTAAKSKPE